MRGFLKRGFTKNSSGNVLVIVALTLLFVLIGVTALAVDAGYIYSERAKMVTAADAASLGGAMQLIDSNLSDAELIQRAKNRAKDIAEINGMDRAQLPEPVVDLQDMTVEVSVGEPRGLFFARIFGRNTAPIAARAKAQVGVASGVMGLVPIGIDKETLEEMQQEQTVLLTQPAGQGQHGNYGFVGFPGSKGAKDVGEDIQYGYDGWIRVGDIIDTETGVKTNSKHVETGVLARVGDTVALPVIWNVDDSEEEFDLTGKTKVKVVGFAAFKITEYYKVGNETVIKGEFVEKIVHGEMGYDLTNYGAMVAVLIE